ncbi:unnamed protein product, partial [Didymodactylos carnosus]
MFLFGFFLQDLNRQLLEVHQAFKLNYLEKQLKVYRGQRMSPVELENLLKQFEKYTEIALVNSSCFSTSLNRSTALSFILEKEKSDQLVGVLFEITIDIDRRCRPFGGISSISAVPRESEVLFMPGVCFTSKKANVTFDKAANFRIIHLGQMEPADINFSSLPEYFESTITRRTLINCVTAVSTDGQLYLASHEQIDRIFDQLVLIFPLETWILAVKEHCRVLKMIKFKRFNMEKEETSLAVSTLEKAMKVWSNNTSDIDLNCFGIIAHLHRTLAWLRGPASTI